MDLEELIKFYSTSDIAPPVVTNAQTLPFNTLTWENFEHLCVRLTLKIAEYKDAVRYGIRGQNQQGIDILATLNSPNILLATFQCKRVTSFKAHDVVNIVREFLGGRFKDNSRKFIIYTSFNCNEVLIQEEILNQKAVLQPFEIDFEIWDEEKLSTELKRHLDLVYDFFGPHWLEAFAGNEIARKFISTHRNYSIINSTKKIEYPKPDNHISRTLIKYSDKIKEHRYSLNSDEYKSLQKILNYNKRIIVLSEASNGKSSELKNIAHEFSQKNNSIFPFLFSLGIYSDENIHDLLPDEYKALPSENILFIFDGLDEIPDINRKTFIRKIQVLLKSNSNIPCIISSRENFYTPESDESSGTIELFESFILSKLSHEQIVDYLDSNLNPLEKNNFEEQVELNNLQELISNPFYLINLVKIFKINSSLPKRRAEIFSILTDINFDLDNDHFKNSQDIILNKSLILKTVQKISIAMELIGLQKISETELQNIIPDIRERNLLICTSIIKKSNDHYEFIHNNFREYLAAQILSKQSYHVVKTFFFIGNKLSPKRINVLAFLSSILNKTDLLFDQLYGDIRGEDLEIFVSMEEDKLSTETRFEIFKHILLGYKKKKIFIDRYVFNLKKLASFAESEQTLKFLLSEIKTCDVLALKRNAIEMLGFFRNYSDHIDDIEVMLFEQIEFGENYDKFISLHSLANLGLNSKTNIDKVLNILKGNENDYVLAGIYYYIITSDYLDDYIEKFLDGVHIHRYTWTPNSTESETRVGDERIYLVHGLENIKDIKALKKFCEYFSKHPRDFHDIFFHHFEKLISSFVASYKTDNTIFEDILNLIVHLEEDHLADKELNMLYEFFDQTNTNLRAYKETENLQIHEYTKTNILTKVSNMDVLNYLLLRNKNNEISDEYIIEYLKNLLWKNKEEYGIQYKIANERNNNRFTIVFPEKIDYEDLRIKGLQKFIDLIFDKEKFIAHVHEIISSLGKDEFTSKDLIDLHVKLFDENKPDDFVINNMSSLMNQDKLLHNELIIYYETLDWTSFILDEIYQYESNGWKFHLSEEQVDFIRQWCNSNLDVNFKTSLVKTSRGYTLTDIRAMYLWFYFRFLKLDFPIEIILDMLSFDWLKGIEWVGINYLDDFLKRSEIKERIIQNLSGGNENERAILNQIKYCNQHNIKEVTKYLPDIINNSLYEYETRREALLFYVKLETNYERLKNLVVGMDDFKWLVINILYKDAGINLELELKKIFNNSDEEDKLRASAFLLKHDNIEALTYIVEIFKRNKKTPTFKWYLEYSPYSEITSPTTLPLLLELLDVVYSNDFIDKETFSMKNTLLSIFERIALNNGEHTFLEVKEKLKNFIENNSYKNSQIDYINITIDNIEKQYYMSETKTYTIKDALNLISEMSI